MNAVNIYRVADASTTTASNGRKLTNSYNMF